jgi:rhodanese-related sulfurtransferase
MTSPTEITAQALSRQMGLPTCPALIDVRMDDDYRADPRILPASRRYDHRSAAAWSHEFKGQRVVVFCEGGAKLSQGAAAWLRQEGIEAESLEGGIEGWRNAGFPLVSTAKLPSPDASGRTVWVTRARPKIDRVACPWLIRRFVDPKAVILFVAPSEVMGVAERFSATPFDVEGVFWSHRGELCTFDVMIEEFALDLEPLKYLARIVRGADTSRLDLAPEAPGLLAASLGFSRMYKDDLAQLDAALGLYDALYRWCRDARDETHNWPAKVRA